MVRSAENARTHPPKLVHSVSQKRQVGGGRGWGEVAGRHSPRRRRGWLLELSGAGGAWRGILTVGRREFLQLLVLLAYVLGQRAPCLAAVLQVLAHSCWAALPKWEEVLVPQLPCR